MGRTKKYDVSEVLRIAMLTFWKKGFESVSTRELADEMKINQFSLYASFESKEALFERALDYYFQHIIQDWLTKPLMKEGAGKESLREFFEAFVDTSGGIHPSGCMIFNTMMTDQAKRPQISNIIEKYETCLSEGFAEIIRNDFPDASHADVNSKASLLLCLLAGIAVKKRFGFNGPPVQTVVDQIIRSIYNEEV